MQQQPLMFEARFLEKHAGEIISSTPIAIVELVANAWDAYATEVEITWPDAAGKTGFAIRDNGIGMTPDQFARRWSTLDYDRVAELGKTVQPPSDLPGGRPRPVYGRNGKGRFASFRFGNPYRVRTWRDGLENTYSVQRGGSQPFDVQPVGSRENVPGHGTEITAVEPQRVIMSEDEAREVIGTRFLADPNFRVALNGTTITFDDIPGTRTNEAEIEVPGYGSARLIVIDTLKADRTTKQHGIAWRVNSRLVGNLDWAGFDDRIADGRTSEAKRFVFIVFADFLVDAVLPDWTGFDPKNEAWQVTRPYVHSRIREFLAMPSAERRRETKDAVRHRLGKKVSQLPPVGRERWNEFVDKVVDTCPSISPDEVEQVASILANLELSNSQFGLVSKLHDLPPGDLDMLNSLLEDWTVRLAKDALDEIQTRLRLISELDTKLRDENMDEVGDLQPLFERSLWVFGPEFESIEFTSNRGMTTVIRDLLGATVPASRLRPDFVMLPDGSAGFYSRDSHDTGHEVDGVAHLVIAEIKKPGVVIGSDEKAQPWRYVTELIKKGLLTESARVTCFVLGSKIGVTEAEDDTRWGGRVLIRAMSYNTFVRRAEKRMLGLRDKLRDAPFLKEHGVDAGDFLQSKRPYQDDLGL